MENTQKVAPPFSYTFSPNVPELLQQLNCSVSISTYQTGKIVIFSPKNNDSLIQLPRNFRRPMGMALKDGKWAMALQDEILVTSNAPGLAKNYPDKPNTYDALFIPRTSYYTGQIDVHDLAWAGDELVAVNTAFSCLMKLNDQYSFEPTWKPPFVTELTPDDRCHLNGLALKDGKPKYVTALGTTNEGRAWKPGMLTNGVLMDIDTNEIILKDLQVPHSPRLYDDHFFMLLSATGELVKVNVNNGSYEVVTKLNGFLRGMDRIGDYLFIAMSKLRQTSSLFKEAPVAKQSVYCGISIIYIPTGKQIGYIIYQNSVEELFEVKVLPGMQRPNILNLDKGLHKASVTLPDKVFWRQADKTQNENNENKS